MTELVAFGKIDLSVVRIGGKLINVSQTDLGNPCHPRSRRWAWPLVVVVCLLGGTVRAQPLLPTIPGPTLDPTLRPARPLQPGPGLAPTPVPGPGFVPTPVPVTADLLPTFLTEGQICLVFSEKLANRFVRTQTRDEGPVRDFVLGAHVTGVQQTEARSSIDFVPSPHNARMLLKLDGVTHNQTRSFTPQAIVDSEGSYQFQLSKQIDFNGLVLQTRTPSAFMTTNLRHRAVQTPMSSVPLIGPLSNRAAMAGAEQRRPQSEWIAATRMTEQIGPRFNQEVDQQLAAINRWLAEQARPKLAEWQALPAHVHSATTDDALLLSASLVETPPRLPLPAHLPDTGDAAVLFVHESALNDMLAKTPLAGLEVPDTALQRLLKREPAEKGEPAVPQLATMVFDPVRPLHVSIQQGQIQIEIRVAFRPVLGPPVPTQVITLNLRPKLSENLLTAKMQLHDVRPLDPAHDDAVTTIAQNILRQQIQQQLEDLRFPAHFEIPMRNHDEKVPLRVRSLNVDGGWMMASFSDDPEETCPVDSQPEFQTPILEGPRLP